MTDEHESFIADLAAYALGSLDEPERTRLEAHLDACPACARRLADYGAVVGTLPLGLEPAPPPPQAWSAIRAAVRARPPAAPRSATRALARWWRGAVPVGLAAAAVLLLVWNVTLQRELAGYTSGPQVEALARRPGRLIVLAGTGTPGASGRLFITVNGDHGHLAVAGLSPLPPERRYQLWFVQAGATATTGGTFSVDGRGRAWVWVDVPVSLDATRAITVTEEPARGGPGPTGGDLLAARSWR